MKKPIAIADLGESTKNFGFYIAITVAATIHLSAVTQVFKLTIMKQISFNILIQLKYNYNLGHYDEECASYAQRT